MNVICTKNFPYLVGPTEPNFLTRFFFLFFFEICLSICRCRANCQLRDLKSQLSKTTNSLKKKKNLHKRLTLRLIRCTQQHSSPWVCPIKTHHVSTKKKKKEWWKDEQKNYKYTGSVSNLPCDYYRDVQNLVCTLFVNPIIYTNWLRKLKGQFNYIWSVSSIYGRKHHGDFL